MLFILKTFGFHEDGKRVAILLTGKMNVPYSLPPPIALPEQLNDDMYYALYNSKVFTEFINHSNSNFQLMYKTFELQINFLNSRILQLESEIQELKKV